MSKKHQYILHLFSVLIILAANSPGKIFAQSQTLLKGIVLNQSTNKPIEFANISIKNTASGTTTNQKGFFEISVKQRKHPVLVISHINFHKKEIAITDSLLSSGFNVFIESKCTQLCDLVVSANLYEQPMNKLTKSVSLITHREIADNMNSN